MKAFYLFFLVICLNLSGFAQDAGVQFIHNAADVSLDTVDIYMDGTLWQDDFPFHASTAFLSVAAGAHELTVADMSSTGTDFPILTQNVTFAPSSSVILVLNGCTNPGTYFPFQPLTIYQFDAALETGSSGAGTDILFFQGSTDAPVLDLQETELIQLTAFEDVSYGSFQGYLNLPGANYAFALADASGQDVYASYDAPLADLGFGGDAVTILSSGFFNQAFNNGGEAPGLWVASAAGGNLIPLAVQEWNLQANLQIIHNAGDAALATVDVYMNDSLIVDNLSFRYSTSFLEVPGGQIVSIGLAPSGSSSSAEAIYTQTYNLLTGQSYIAVANGIYSASGYNPSLPFDLYSTTATFTSAPIPSDVMILATHGITDLGSVDIAESDLWNMPLVTNLSYGNFSSYFSMPADDYELTLSLSSGGVIEEYDAPFSSLGLAGQAITLVGSGFANPELNSNGPGAGLWVSLATGGALIPLEPVADPPVYARIQFIHNSPDEQFQTVDLFLNGELIHDNFSFRQALAFEDILAGGIQTLGIAGPDAESAADILFSYELDIAQGEIYLAVITGAVSSGYNPFFPIQVHLVSGAREQSVNGNETDVMIFNGSTDAGLSDVLQLTPVSGVLSDDLAYSDYEPYVSFGGSEDVGLTLTNGTGSVILGSYTLPISAMNLAGESIVLFTSGFQNPANNNDGEPIWMWAAQADGSSFALPVYVSVGELFEQASLVVYPNPSSGVFQLKGFLKEMNPLRLQVVNNENKVVLERMIIPSNKAIHESIDLSFCSNGHYSILVSDSRLKETIRFTLLR